MTSPRLERLAASTRTEAEARERLSKIKAERCPECGGEGRVITDNYRCIYPCPACNGTGKRQSKEGRKT